MFYISFLNIHLDEIVLVKDFLHGCMYYPRAHLHVQYTYSFMRAFHDDYP
jgi:hypothetical protein